jgi:hypothetical protein
MMAEAIGFVLRNLPAFLLVIALLVAAVHRGRRSTPERFLSWLLLLPVGVTRYGPPCSISFSRRETASCINGSPAWRP